MNAETATYFLSLGMPVRDAQIRGAWRLRDMATAEQITVPLVMQRCVVDKLDASFAYYHAPVVLTDVHVVGGCNLRAGYFYGGFSALRCRFYGTFDAESGGHNRNGSVYSLVDCHFEKFANFGDDWFEGPVVVRGCTFRRGTNLLGSKGQPAEVNFEVSPVVEGNVGVMDLNGFEGVG
jgi:hypothetical protein